MSSVRGSINWSKGSLRLVVKQNEVYAEKLNTLMKGLPKQVLGAYAATALNNAIEMTKHDSSRAGANWALLFGNTAPPNSLNPKSYGSYPIGERDDHEANKAVTLKYKQDVYGYYAKYGVMIPKKDGWIYRALKIGEKGTAPVVRLYNPVITPELLRYAQNAFPSQDMSAISSSVLAGAGGGINMANMSRQFLPQLIREISAEMKTKHAQGKI
jgi:hypothetical protein